MRLSIEVPYNEFLLSLSSLNGSIIGQLLNLFLAEGGVSARSNGMLRPTEKVAIVWVRSPASFNFKLFFTLNLFVTPPVRACRRNFKSAPKRFDDGARFESLEIELAVVSSNAGVGR